MKRSFRLALVVLAAAALTACATPAAPGSSAIPSSAPSAASDIEVEAAWLDGGRMIGLVTWGSSTCIPMAEEATFADGVVDVTLVDSAADAVCTADMAPRVTLVGTPEGVDPSQGVEIRVASDQYTGDADLDGVAGLVAGGETDYLPSAGWFDDGAFAILTWGSSSCAPVIESVSASSASEVVATVATPPADQVCTMDMAPRAVIASVEGDLDDAVTLVLTGGEFADVRTPILGDN